MERCGWLRRQREEQPARHPCEIYCCQMTWLPGAPHWRTTAGAAVLVSWLATARETMCLAALAKRLAARVFFLLVMLVSHAASGSLAGTASNSNNAYELSAQTSRGKRSKNRLLVAVCTGAKSWSTAPEASAGQCWRERVGRTSRARAGQGQHPLADAHRVHRSTAVPLHLTPHPLTNL